MTSNHKSEKNDVSEVSKMLPSEKDVKLEDIYRDMPLTDETKCGFWICRSAFLQKFANKKAFVIIYGLMGCVISASYSYFHGTITTIEKRFKIPSKTTGIVTVGNDISQLMVSMSLSYYAGKGHRPRWISFGVYTLVLFCLMTALPQALYGSGLDALSLTSEYGAEVDTNDATQVAKDQQKRTLCNNETKTECDNEEGSFAPKVILFMAQFISGIGTSLYYTLGTAYMDDNIKKSKTPALISMSYFLRMLGPALGYGLASLCLKLYISPNLTPTINNSDPRWLGAWWLGWVIISLPLAAFATIFSLFPKTLPRAAARKAFEQEKTRLQDKSGYVDQDEIASWSDMFTTFKRLIVNPTLMYNNLSSVFYFLGYMPYWIFMPKYIELQYRQSAAVASFVTGSVGLIFSAIGILVSGIVISKCKPRARYLAGWNVFVGALSVAGLLSYVFLGCEANDNAVSLLDNGELDLISSCNSNCNCDYVKYSPVCSENGQTFISACHAGCNEVILNPNGSKIFTNCSCIEKSSAALRTLKDMSVDDMSFLNSTIFGGIANAGSCPVDCQKVFYIFLIVVCIIKFSSSTGRTSNFLVAIRCVEEKDKSVSMGFGLMIISLCAFIPSPILFGFIMDKTCLVWGKTCSGTGNCWLYNGEKLRYIMNITAASFVTIGTIFDGFVWYHVKGLKIFDEEVELETMDETGGLE